MSELSKSVKKLRKVTDQIFDQLEEHSSRLDRLETAKKGDDKAKVDIEMRLRNLEIRFRSSQGEKHVNLAREYGLSEGRISQIASGD